MGKIAWEWITCDTAISEHLSQVTLNKVEFSAKKAVTSEIWC